MSKENTGLPPVEKHWPEPGDMLFRSGDDWWNNACLHFGCHNWELYAIGYKEAADVLVQTLSETQRSKDALIYPIVFLYRHYLELRLKELIVAGQELLDEPSDLQHVHRLDVLWNSCRKILEAVFGSGDDRLDAIESCIQEFSRTDPTSMSFRYPTTRDGQVTLSSMRHINIRNLSEVMQKISSLLEAASMGISAYLDHKRSMRAW